MFQAVVEDMRLRDKIKRGLQSRIPRLSLVDILLFIIIAGLILDLFFGAVEFLSEFPAIPESQQSIIQLLFSGLLVMLYFSQHRTQRVQATIAQSHQEILAANHKPEITIDQWTVEGNEVTFKLSNIGNGIAKDLYFGVYVETRKRPIHPMAKEPDIGESPSILFRTGSGEPSPGNYLEQGEKSVSFRGTAVAPKHWADHPQKWNNIPFSEAVERYADENMPLVAFHPIIQYKDITGQEYRERLFFGSVYTEYEKIDFQEALEKIHELDPSPLSGPKFSYDNRERQNALLPENIERDDKCQT